MKCSAVTSVPKSYTCRPKTRWFLHYLKTGWFDMVGASRYWFWNMEEENNGKSTSNKEKELKERQ